MLFPKCLHLSLRRRDSFAPSLAGYDPGISYPLPSNLTMIRVLLLVPLTFSNFNPCNLEGKIYTKIHCRFSLLFVHLPVLSPSVPLCLFFLSLSLSLSLCVSLFLSLSLSLVHTHTPTAVHFH